MELSHEMIGPETLTLFEIDQQQLEGIAQTVPGGMENVYDIYPLSPLQEGILFHCLLNERGDTYVVPILFELQSHALVAAFVDALKKVIHRHDILRTAVVWEGLSRPVQVVYRQVDLPLDEILLDLDRDPIEQLKELMKPAGQGLNLRQAPPLRLRLAKDARGNRTYALLQLHHIVCDYRSLDILIAELAACLQGREQELSRPSAYRDYVAWTLEHARTEDAEAFFRSKLADVVEPTAPFGVVHVHADADEIEEARQVVDATLAQQVRVQAVRLGVSAARVFHAAWALVVAHTSGSDEVVYGTVLTARTRARLKWSSADAMQDMLGPFINTLPLRLRLAGVTATELIEQTHRELSALSNFEQAPLTLAQRCSGVGSVAPLFTALLNYRRGGGLADREGESAIAAGIAKVARGEVWLNYPVTMIVDAIGEGFALTAQTDRRIDPQRVTAYLHAALKSLVQALDQAPQTAALALSILPESEHQRIKQVFSGAPRVYPQTKLIHELLEERAASRPNAVAVVCEGRSLTYAELNNRSNQLARYLRRKLGGVDALVGICVDRGLEMVVGLLGILKSGGAYLPLDPDYPPERLAYMLRDADPRVVLTLERLRDRLRDTATDVITLDSDWSDIAAEQTDDLDRPSGLGVENLAYVIYTSGSTGEPKGVMVEHRHVTRLFAATAHWFDFNERDIWTLFHSFAFDFSVWELWGALLYGGRIVVVPHATARSPRDFYRLLCDEGVTVLNQTPSAFAQLIDAQAESTEKHSLRVVIFGGEALELRRLRPWVRRNGAERPQLVNMYGITETTVHVTYRQLTEEDIESERSSPIGKPIPDLRIYLLDPHGRVVPIAVAGEIYVGGAGVARGYLNRPELTGKRFIRDPFSADPQERLYKSGDLGRWRADGAIEYLGRNDHQIKIRGFRVELGEIEAQLMSHPQVKGAVVVAREDIAGEKRLVAYVVPSESPAVAPSVEALRTHLKAKLPEHMVPSACVLLGSFPLTANGKLDRNALPAPDERAVPMQVYVAPRNELERKLCEIWAEVFGLPRVGIEDNFFALGGDSILGLRIVGRSRAFGVILEVSDLFRNHNIAQLAPACRTEGGQDSSWPKVDAFELLSPEERAQFVGMAGIEDAYPLSLLQEGMYFHSQVAPQSAVYHNVFSYRIETAFHRDYFERVLRELVQRHPMLRAGFVMSCDRRLVQLIHTSATADLQVEDISELSATAQDSYIREWVGREKHRGFVWPEPPLLRVFVHERTRNAFQCSFSFHHAIVDGWSMACLETELIGHYSSVIKGGEWSIEAPRRMYRDYIAREQRGLQSTASREFWRNLLEGASLPSLPRSGGRSKEKGQEVCTHVISFEPEIGRRLEALAQQLGVHLKILLLAAHVKVMSVICGEPTVVTGMVSNGRLEDEGGDRVLGLHLNSLPLRVGVDEGSWRELIMRLRDLEQLMLPHRHYPLAAIQEAVGSGQLFDTLFNFTRYHVYRQLEDVVTMSMTEMFGQTNFSLLIHFSQEPHGSSFLLSLNFDPAVFGSAQVERIGGYYERALKILAEDVDALHHEEALLGEIERDRVLAQFNRTASLRHSIRLVHELFEEQVERTRNAVAVMYEEQSLTYAELNTRANQLAWFLRRKGVCADQVVGICVDRSLEMVVGLLGIVKAGGAYLPLDPNYPVERLRHMLEDAAPQIVLTQTKLAPMLPVTQAAMIVLDENLEEVGGYAARNLPAAELHLTAQNLVYLIYTSGSTGRPKGTAMAHRSMVNLIEWHRGNFSAREGQRVLQFAALSFDVAFQEIFSSLCTGDTLFLLDDRLRRDARALTQFLSSRSIDRLFIPPLMLQSLAEYFERADAVPKCVLRDVIAAGEQLRISPEMARLFKHLKGCQLHNQYGPTETHVVTALTLTGNPDEWPVLPSIGRPIASTQIYILNAHRQPVPIGVAGEIYIGGAGVARGYLRRPDLTAERFIADPFSNDTRARLYKTGDVGRWQEDGTIEYLGRNDHQVKIRGHRVELGEIEAELVRHAQVRDAVVVAREDAPGVKRLVAYVVPDNRADSAADASFESLRAHSEAVLPEHMVPSAFVALESLPRTPNGKLDRGALPAPLAHVNRQYVAPQGEVETVLAGIWRELLGMDAVSRQDHFFKLGGNSLTSLRLVARVAEAFGIELSVTAVYQYPTLREMGQVVETLIYGEQPSLSPNPAETEYGTV